MSNEGQFALFMFGTGAICGAGVAVIIMIFSSILAS
jgi:hypothetical protein